MLFKRFVNKLSRTIHAQHINIAKTVYANFMFLPFSDAIKFPVLIYGPSRVLGKGEIVFIGKQLKRGQLKIGISDEVRSCFEKNYIEIEGRIECGENVVIRRGARIKILKNGVIRLTDNVYIGDNNTLISVNSICIGTGTRIGNNTTFMDTDFHYIINTQTRKVHKSNSPIEIGENNWIGGNCIVKKGAVTPKGTILAGPFSMIGKNYIGRIPEFCIIGGSPAKLIVENMRRINNDNVSRKLSRYFKENSEDFTFSESYKLDDLCMPPQLNCLNRKS